MKDSNPESLRKLIKDFKPSLLFLGKFLIVYFVFNILYGLYIESYGDRADIVTKWVTEQSVNIMGADEKNISTEANTNEATISILQDGRSIIRIFEGCNGISIMILFMAFIVAFPGNMKTMLWFIPVGFLFIHVANIGRIIMLYWVALYRPEWTFFIHKYIFTGIIYGAIFLLWVIWVTKFSGLKLRKSVE